MPVPQKFSFIVGRTGFPACSSKIQFYCGKNRLSGLFHNNSVLLWNGHLARS
ncbi:hypothetical protein [Microcoleus sp. B5-D4]|uniref:hypothetical protein n=1 Tax=Microcoleus sp. B5-D4 TaxID=2818681 RepID=UPI002FD21891